LCLCCGIACRELLALYKEEKAAGSFEVRRPRTTKEVAVHNNQLMQNMPQLVAAYILQNQQQQQQQQGGVSAWCQQMQSKPQAPRPSAEEQEQQAADMLERLVQRAKQLDDEGIGGCMALKLDATRRIWFSALPIVFCS